jgi:regulator of sirC expression with transglutaminase-like and TPR domain
MRMNLDAALNLLSQQPDVPLDVAELALHLARDEYPNLDVEAHLAELNAMAYEARRYLRGDLAARVTGLGRYLFHEMGFRGNVREYYDARNSYFNVVLERRTGIPLTLSAVAIAVGTRAGLDVLGVGLPGHFIAKARADGREVLFDPYHGGRVLTPADCEHLVQQVTGHPFEITAERLIAMPLGYVVQRWLNNLKGAYLRQGDFRRAVRVMERLRQLDTNDPVQRRDLGATLLHAGQPGKAIDHLTAYLKAVPCAGDTDAVRQLLQQAQRHLAAWN